MAEKEMKLIDALFSTEWGTTKLTGVKVGDKIRCSGQAYEVLGITDDAYKVKWLGSALQLTLTKKEL